MSANPRLHTLSLQSYYIAEDNSTQVTQETTYTYDATDNIVADGTHTYTYDSRNRLIGVDDNITYQYNYDNKRVSKTVNGTTTYFIYDAHKLVGEYDSEGNAIKEYVYSGNTPIAMIDANGVQKIYADHLDTPRRVADIDNTIVWSWESKPFGEDEANGSITLNLRFPGQYFYAETKTHYNINRDYNPVTGRYIQSDPIGLEGGINTYLYAGANPVGSVDENGLLVDAYYYLSKELLYVFDGVKSVKMSAFSGGTYLGGTFSGDSIPLGDYEILERGGDRDYFRLDALDSKPRNDIHEPTGRDLFRLHKPGRSIGCITAKKADEWIKVREFIYSTSTELIEVASKRFYGLWETTEQIKKYGTLRVYE